jgi:N-carbamoylputrescine amidase
MKKVINVALIQMSCSDDVQENFNKTVDYIRQAASRGAHIVCTQELFKSRYFCQVMDPALFKLAEAVDENSATVRALRELAAELEIVIIASLFEKRATGLYHNTAVVLDADGGYLGKYRKMHIPNDPLYYEKFYFTPGDLGYKVFNTRYANIGVLICWDQWFPEAARLTAMLGAEIIFYPTAIGHTLSEKTPAEEASYSDAWQTVQRGHAIANACYVAAVNRVGFEENPAALLRIDPTSEPGIDFWGGSFIASPDGDVLQNAGRDENVLICPIDLSCIAQVRDRESFPWRDRRVDSYAGLTRRYLDGESSTR